VAKRRKNRRSSDDDVVRIELQPDRELQRQWAGLYVPYIYCPHCKHVYSPDELNRFDRDDPLPLPVVDDDGVPEGARELPIGCTRCSKARLVRVLVDFSQVEPYRIGASRLGISQDEQTYFCVCPLCGGACQIQRTGGIRTTEQWYCGTCDLNLRRVWM
jgi:hypothetical protein